ncbi:MAG TPA: PAS domain S-box protein [Anaerolineales bacterium]
MNKPTSSLLSSPLKWGAFKIAGIYLLIGSLWILFSDRLAERIALNKEMLVSLSLYKGWGYVIVTAFLLYWLIQRYTSRLHASDKQLQLVINALPVLISYIDKNQRYQFANEAYEEWFGEKAQGKHIEEVVGQATYQKTSKYIDKVLKGETVTYETEILDQDGEERFVSATYVPNIAANGQLRGFFTLVQDISEQKEAREKLRQWADAFEGCAHGIAIGDPDTNRIVVCNPAFANMLKCRVEDIVGSSILSLYAASDHEHVRHNVERADQIGHVRYEAQMNRKDGSIFPVQMDVVSVLGEDGELLYRVATAQDISERKQAEVALLTSEERYRTLVEQASDGIFMADSRGKYTEVNSSGCAMLGYSREELLKLSLRDVVDPEDLAAHPLRLKELEEGKTLIVERKLHRKDGSTFLAELSAKMLPSGHYQAVMRDITERKQAEESLRNSQAQMTGIFDSAMDAIISTDTDQRILIFNPAAEAMFRCDHSEALGQPLNRFIPERFREAHHKYVHNFGQTGVTNRAMKRSAIVFGRRSNGDEFPCEASISQINIAGKKIYTVILRDVSDRRQAEEELSRSEEKYRHLFENNPHPMWVYDRKTLAFLDVNEAAMAKYGYSRQEFLNMTILDIRPPEDVDRLMKNLAQPRQPLEHSGGWRHRLKDGTIIPIEITSHTVEIDGHESALVIAQDITERKQAEEKLRKSEDLFSKAFHGSPAPMTIARRADGTYIEVNKSFLDMVECEREEVIGHTSLDLNLINSEGRAEITRQLRQQGVIHNVEVQAKSKSGRRINMLTSIENTELAGEACTITTMLDITERKQAEAALQKAHDELELKVEERTAALSQANALLQALMDYVPDHIYFKDLQCRFIRNSRSQASLLGLSDPAQVVGKTDFDFFPHAAKAYAEEQEVMQSGKPLVDFEEWVVWPDGRETWVSTTKVPLRNSDGETIGIFGISRDITERKRAEQAIRHLNSGLEDQATKLQVANKELEAFSYSVSHDLRAPLRAIDGYTRILVEDYEAILDAEGKRVCGIISAEARRMGQLIDDLLAFSRLGRKEMFSSNIDMKALAVSVLNELIKEEDREHIDFKIARLPSVKADASLMRQVWMNLLSNAIKFTSKKERAVIEVGSESNKDELIYYVRDTGAGFDMEYANKLFGVFQRLHSESEFEGTGVGLAIVQRIVRRHGGRIWAEGEVDKGATFYFALPRKENHHE